MSRRVSSELILGEAQLLHGARDLMGHPVSSVEPILGEAMLLRGIGRWGVVGR
ncbi:MAG: hypothetical protein ACK2T3_10795 [Candidatus Promineifilaceae bacterium]